MTVYTPKTYRKTALMQAIRWDGTDECLAALHAWGAEIAPSPRAPTGWCINTREGWRDIAHPDSYISRGPAGDFYEHEASILEANHEAVETTKRDPGKSDADAPQPSTSAFAQACRIVRDRSHAADGEYKDAANWVLDEYYSARNLILGPGSV